MQQPLPSNQAGTILALYPIAEQDHLYGLCVAIRTGEFFYFVINREITEEYLNEKLSNLLDSRIFTACYQLKELYSILPSLYGKKGLFDVKVAAYLLNPLEGAYPLEELQKQYPQILNISYSSEMTALLGLVFFAFGSFNFSNKIIPSCFGEFILNSSSAKV